MVFPKKWLGEGKIAFFSPKYISLATTIGFHHDDGIPSSRQRYTVMAMEILFSPDKNLSFSNIIDYRNSLCLTFWFFFLTYWTLLLYIKTTDLKSEFTLLKLLFSAENKVGNRRGDMCELQYFCSIVAMRFLYYVLNEIFYLLSFIQTKNNIVILW